MSDWSPTDYLKFADERTRPARDLLAQVPLDQPLVIYDFGCGPSNSRELLVKAFPEAKIIGLDSPTLSSPSLNRQ
jgi:trans-aconitate 2-methyltransferase